MALNYSYGLKEIHIMKETETSTNISLMGCQHDAHSTFIIVIFSCSLCLSLRSVWYHEQELFLNWSFSLLLTHTYTHYADIDECEHSGGSLCDHECVNTVGSFLCRCRTGYILAPDQRSCVPIHNCEFLCFKVFICLLCSNRVLCK